ncbi:hypothetical protein DPMN_040335 [Dreissena polymorpha]|uniref:Uncharacterized protein n=1 Tax=Dreissena polymorpha TaxID=45954 RepID=A0A9D4CXL1_DREPO|nr:hypothetical protein DPMN_040335 [Dreissena polymorpha]
MYTSIPAFFRRLSSGHVTPPVVCIAHLLSIYIQVSTPCIPFVLCTAALECHMRFSRAKGAAYPSPTSLKDVFFNGLLLCSPPYFFVGVLV